MSERRRLARDVNEKERERDDDAASRCEQVVKAEPVEGPASERAFHAVAREKYAERSAGCGQQKGDHQNEGRGRKKDGCHHGVFLMQIREASNRVW